MTPKLLQKKVELTDKPTRSVSADLLNEAVMLDITYHRWTNRRKTDATPIGQRKSDKAADRLRTTMKLIESPAYDAILTYLAEVRTWILQRCMPSFVVNGIFFVKLDAVAAFETKLAEARRWLEEVGIPALITDYPRAKEQARADFADIAFELKIEGLYNDFKYPAASEFWDRFGVEHNWITFSVPASLPREIRQQEEVKIRERFDNAAEEITRALREGFQELIAHATERLTAAPGEKKIIRDSLVDNFRTFCETFRFRNLTDDRELEELVSQAEAIMTNVQPDRLRNLPSARRAVAAQLTAIKSAVDKLITDAPVRRLDLNDEEDT